MERESHEHSKVVKLLEKIPSWVQMLITIGTLVFGLGVTYANIQDMKVQLSSLKDVPTINQRQDGDIQALRQQIADDRNVQSQTNVQISKLADAVSSLSTSVARLEGMLEQKEKKHR